MQKKLLSLFSVSLASVLFFCNPQEVETKSCGAINDPTADKYIQITYPTEIDTLQVGQKISIQFKFQNMGALKTGISAMAVLRVGKIDHEITTPHSIPFNATDTITCAEIPWTAGFGDVTPPADENPVKVTLRVYQYGAESDYIHRRNFYIKK